ncbi:hypothetical protein ALC57_16457 [Trachymyrmex cornetzi]|uniref:Endonuclease/exonuclease/phosphatase domain-containing protein n=1 Tax=Trachymyrmex cornetzi TaxID=471704 RepID=A0A151IV22_9HYME|nr:hypothetical protein ALC57_16457 [Trachymyrmex cornetzi]
MSRNIKGRGGKEVNQRNLDFRKDSNKTGEKKKVTFEEEGEANCPENKVREAMKEIAELKECMLKEMEEVKKERKRLTEIEEGWKNKERSWEIRIRILEENREELGKEVRSLREVIENRDRELEDGKSEAGDNGKSRGESRIGSWWSSRGGSDISEDRLSTREVGKLRKWISDKKKWERKNNIVLKGVDLNKARTNMKGEGREDWAEWIRNYLQVKLGLSCGIVGGRVSGRVIIATLENEVIKRDIMSNKYKLKGEQVYIENDLSWEERKIQERINKWAKEKKEIGEDIKIARGQEGRGEGREHVTEEEEKGRNRKVLFWNVAGVESKDRDFWRFITGHDYIGLNETWLTQKIYEHTEVMVRAKDGVTRSFLVNKGVRKDALGKDLYSREKEKYYNRNGWSKKAIEELRNKGINIVSEIRKRDRDIQIQVLDNKIREAKYNKKYKEIGTDRPSYLLKENLNKIMKGDGVRGLVRVRCGNMEEYNKYWLREEDRLCRFCGAGQDDLKPGLYQPCFKHYIADCLETKAWFEDLGGSIEDRLQRIWDDKLDDKKGEILVKLWKAKEGRLKERNSVRNGEKAVISIEDIEKRRQSRNLSLVNTG